MITRIRLPVSKSRADHKFSAARRVEKNVRWARTRVDLFVLCEDIYQLSKQGRYYFSPVRDDGRNAAFEVRADGEVAIDHATGRGFNLLTLIAKVENLSLGEARRRLIFYAEQRAVLPVRISRNTEFRRIKMRAADGCLYRYEWSFLENGRHDDYLNFARLRGLSPISLITASALRLFFFHTDKRHGQRLCTITDDARYVRQDRCVDGGNVTLSEDGAVKSRTIGSGSWPVGAENVGAKPFILLVEGMPDLLAAVEIIANAQRLHDTAAVALLGAGQRIHPLALRHFAGKRVRIFPDNDAAGLKAAEIWQQQLRRAGAIVDFFSYEKFDSAGELSIKDLNDFVIATGGTIAGQSVMPGPNSARLLR